MQNTLDGFFLAHQYCGVNASRDQHGSLMVIAMSCLRHQAAAAAVFDLNRVALEGELPITGERVPLDAVPDGEMARLHVVAI